MEKKVGKQTALSLKTKIGFLQTVDEGSLWKSEICIKKFGVPNSTLSTIIKNWDKIEK
jgi:hypothetical protein